MRISLTPRTSEFFTLFGQAGEHALEGSRLGPRASVYVTLFGKPGETALEVSRRVERRFREHPNSGITQEQVKKEETEGDAITRELITLLNTQYVTPFERHGRDTP